MADISLPQLSSVLSRVKADLSPGGIAPSVQQAFGQARTGIQSDYATEGRAEQAYIPQAFAQAGGIYNTGQITDAKRNAAQALDFERRQAMKRLDFEEAAAGMTQFNSLMNLLGSGAGAGLNLASGFAGAQSQAIGGMSTQSPGWGAVGGAASGAALGTQISPGYGTAIGALLGGLGGYLGAGG